MAESTKYVWRIAKQENDDAVAKIKAAKTTEVYVLPPAEKAVWRKAMLPLYRSTRTSSARTRCRRSRRPSRSPRRSSRLKEATDAVARPRER